MKKYVTVLLTLALLSLAVFGSGMKFSVLTFYTTDLQNGSYNVWPILYLRIPLTNSFRLNFEDYVMGTHKTFSIGNFQIMQPTYWYMSYRNGDLSAYVGRFKSRHTLTRQMYLLRVGGLYDTVTGAEVDFKNYTYDLGLRYDWKYSEFAAYGGLLGNDYKVYLYASKGNKISLSSDFFLSLKNVSLWGAAAYDLDPSNISFGIPTVLIGGKTYFGALNFAAQYAWRPNQDAAKIWYDFNDPNKVGYPLKDFNSLLTYNFNRRNSIGLLMNWNSNLSVPTFGVKFSHGDLSVTLGSGDLNGGISGVQYLTLDYSNYFSIPLTTHPIFSPSQRSW